MDKHEKHNSQNLQVKWHIFEMRKSHSHFCFNASSYVFFCFLKKQVSSIENTEDRKSLLEKLLFPFFLKLNPELIMSDVT